MADLQKRIHIIIQGKVQGVFFRASTVAEVNRIGSLSGYVQNLIDGSVEIVAEGPEKNLEKLVTWARKGPPQALVENISVTWEMTQGNLSSFIVKR